MFVALPQGKSYEDKLLIGVFGGFDELIGVLDVIRDHPESGEWSLGLMLLDSGWRGRGVGEKTYRAFERWAAESGARRIRLGVVEQNEGGYRFWQRMGFETVDRRPPQRFGNRESVVIVMRRYLAA